VQSYEFSGAKQKKVPNNFLYDGFADVLPTLCSVKATARKKLKKGNRAAIPSFLRNFAPQIEIIYIK